MAVTSCENANDTIIAYYNNRPNRKSQFHEHLIKGATSSRVDALSTPPSQAVYQSLKESLWYCLPLCHKHTGKMCMIGGWGMVTSKSTS